MAKTVQKGSKVTAKPASKKPTAKRAGGTRGGLAAPMTPSPELAEIVGKSDLPRSEVVSKVWAYIKKHGLQDANNKRQINGDDRLVRVFGTKHATMFELNKHLSRHLSKPES